MILYVDTPNDPVFGWKSVGAELQVPLMILCMGEIVFRCKTKDTSDDPVFGWSEFSCIIFRKKFRIFAIEVSTNRTPFSRTKLCAQCRHESSWNYKAHVLLGPIYTLRTSTGQSWITTEPNTLGQQVLAS